MSLTGGQVEVQVDVAGTGADAEARLNARPVAGKSRRPVEEPVRRNDVDLRRGAGRRAVVRRRAAVRCEVIFTVRRDGPAVPDRSGRAPAAAEALVERARDGVVVLRRRRGVLDGRADERSRDRAGRADELLRGGEVVVRRAARRVRNVPGELRAGRGVGDEPGGRARSREHLRLHMRGRRAAPSGAHRGRGGRSAESGHDADRDCRTPNRPAAQLPARPLRLGLPLSAP